MKLYRVVQINADYCANYHPAQFYTFIVVLRAGTTTHESTPLLSHLELMCGSFHPESLYPEQVGAKRL